VGAMDHRQVDLHRPAVVDDVAEEHLRGKTIDVFAVVRHFLAVHLKRAEARVLRGGAGKKTLSTASSRQRGGIDGTEVARAQRLRTRGRQNCQGQNFLIFHRSNSNFLKPQYSGTQSALGIWT